VSSGVADNERDWKLLDAVEGTVSDVIVAKSRPASNIDRGVLGRRVRSHRRNADPGKPSENLQQKSWSNGFVCVPCLVENENVMEIWRSSKYRSVSCYNINKFWANEQRSCGRRSSVIINNSI